MTRKNTEFVWNKEHDRAFSEIKNILSCPPVLEYYDVTIQSDASNKSVGEVLL